jgi:hypothetical protein
MSNVLSRENLRLEWGELNYFLENSIQPMSADIIYMEDVKSQIEDTMHNPYKNMSWEDKYKVYLAIQRSKENCTLSREYYRHHMWMLWVDHNVSMLIIELNLIDVLNIKTWFHSAKSFFINPYLWIDKPKLAEYNDILRNLKFRNEISQELYIMLDRYIKEATDKSLAAC